MNINMQPLSINTNLNRYNLKSKEKFAYDYSTTKNNIAFEAKTVSLNKLQKTARPLILSAMMLFSIGSFAQNNNTSNSTTQSTIVTTPFNLNTQERRLENQNYSHEVVDQLIAAEKRKQTIYKNLSNSTTPDLFYFNEDFKITDSTETFNKFNKAIEKTDNKTISGIPSVFSKIEQFCFDSIQKANLTEKINELSTKNLMGLINIQLPQNLSDSIKSSDDVKNRETAYRDFYAQIDTEINNAKNVIDKKNPR